MFQGRQRMCKGSGLLRFLRFIFQAHTKERWGLLNKLRPWRGKGARKRLGISGRGSHKGQPGNSKANLCGFAIFQGPALFGFCSAQGNLCLALPSLPTVYAKTFLEVHSESEREGCSGGSTGVCGCLRIHGGFQGPLPPWNYTWIFCVYMHMCISVMTTFIRSSKGP